MILLEDIASISATEEDHAWVRLKSGKVLEVTVEEREDIVIGLLRFYYEEC